MQARIMLRRASAVVSLVAALSASPLGVSESVAQQESRPAFVIIERTATAGDESIQEGPKEIAPSDGPAVSSITSENSKGELPPLQRLNRCD
jgi:hypothetical protein